MYYVYILRLNNNQLYTGYTSYLKRRIAEHKAGQSEFTATRLPVELSLNPILSYWKAMQ